MTPNRWTRAASVTLAGALTSLTLSLAPAAAEPYPWHNQSDNPLSRSASTNKAQVEYRERLAAEQRALPNKAQVEYRERVAARSGSATVTNRPPAPTPAPGVPWPLVGFAALGVAAGAVAVMAVRGTTQAISVR